MGLIVVAPELSTRLAVQRALASAPPLLSTMSVTGALDYARQTQQTTTILLCPPLIEVTLEEAAAAAAAQGLRVMVWGAPAPRGAVEVTDLSTLSRVQRALKGPDSNSTGSTATDSSPGRTLSPRLALPSPLRSSPPPVVLLGASTGGPRLLTQILGELPADFPAAVVVAQHIVEGFGAALAEALQGSTRLTAREAVPGERYQPAHIYLAPVGHHIGLDDGSLKLDPGPPKRGYRPSIDHLFQSACQTRASHVAAAVLTGMGNDGAEGLACLHQQGALTLVQDPATATVASMPQEALARLRLSRVLTPAEFPAVLHRWAQLAQHLDSVPAALAGKEE